MVNNMIVKKQPEIKLDVLNSLLSGTLAPESTSNGGFFMLM